MSNEQLPQQKDIDIDTEIIQDIIEAQNEIFKEDSRHIIENCCKKEHIHSLKKKIEAYFIEQKLYYEIVRILLSNEDIINSDTKKLKNDQINSQIENLETKISDKQIEIPELSSLLDKIIEKELYDQLEDILTFSIIPSYFQFFWSDPLIYDLINFFLAIRDKPSIYDSLARVSFLSPKFLYYSNIALQPFFTYLLNEKTKVYESVCRFNFLIPKETLVVLCCSSDKERTFKDSFLNYALSSSSRSHLYKILHWTYDIKDLEEISDEIISELVNQMTSNNPIYDKISSKVNISGGANTNIKQTGRFKKEESDDDNYNAIDEEDEEGDDNGANISSDQDRSFLPITELFNQVDFDVLPEIFQPLFISSNDFTLLKLYAKDIELLRTEFKPVHYRKMKYYRTYNINTEKPKNRAEQSFEITQQNQPGMIAPYLRHLLQLTDKLPVFKQIPPNVKTLRDFFEIYLVQRGDIRTYEKRKIYSDNIFNFPGLDLPKLSEAIKKIGFNRKKDLKALSSFSNINPTANKLKIETQNQIDHLNLLLSIKLTNITIDMNPKKCSKEFFIKSHIKSAKKDLSYIIQDPAFFIDLFHNQPIFESSQSDYAKKILLNQILNKFNFDFSTFKDCLIKDKVIAKISSDFTLYFSDAGISTQFLLSSIVSTGGFNKREYCQKFFETFPPHQQTELYCKDIEIDFNKEFCDTIAQMIKVAFTEKSILKKLELFSNFFMLIENEVNSYLPAGEILEKGEIQPLQASILMRINPPDMLINIILIHNFFNERLTSIPEKKSTFEITGYDSTIRIVPKMVFEEYNKNFNIETICLK